MPRGSQPEPPLSVLQQRDHGLVGDFLLRWQEMGMDSVVQPAHAIAQCEPDPAVIPAVHQSDFLTRKNLLFYCDGRARAWGKYPESAVARQVDALRPHDYGLVGSERMNSGRKGQRDKSRTVLHRQPVPAHHPYPAVRAFCDLFNECSRYSLFWTKLHNPRSVVPQQAAHTCDPDEALVVLKQVHRRNRA